MKEIYDRIIIFIIFIIAFFVSFWLQDYIFKYKVNQILKEKPNITLQEFMGQNKYDSKGE